MTRGRRLDITLAVALAVAAFALYARTLAHGFINLDDPTYVLNNERVLGGLTASNAAWAFRTFFFANWHPLTWLTYQLDVTLWGPGAFGFHLTNTLLHAANAALLFTFLRMATGKRWPSLLVAALFAAHPVHIESVAWVSQRKDVLFLFFGLLALIAYVRYTRRRSIGAYLLVLALYGCSLMAKSMLVTFPFLLLLLDGWPLDRVRLKPVDKPGALPPWRLLLEKIPLVVMATAVSAATMLAQRGGGAVVPLSELGFEWRLQNVVAAAAGYLQHLAWPAGLAVFYPFLTNLLTPGRVLVSLGVIIVLTVAALWAARRFPWATVGWFWFLGALVPVIGFVQIGRQSMADRYLYLPAIGIYIAVAWAVATLVERDRLPRNWAVAGACCVVGLLAALNVWQTGYWRSSEALFERALNVTELNFLAHQNLALAWMEDGRVHEALPHFERAVLLQPSKEPYWINLVRAWRDAGNEPKALEAALAALKRHPRSAALHLETGRLLLDARPAEGLEFIGRAVELAGAAPGYRLELARALADTGRKADARALLESLRESLPPDSELLRQVEAEQDSLGAD